MAIGMATNGTTPVMKVSGTSNPKVDFHYQPVAAIRVAAGFFMCYFDENREIANSIVIRSKQSRNNRLCVASRLAVTKINFNSARQTRASHPRD